MLAIQIENLSKRYRVNHARQQAEYQTLRETLVRMATAPWRRLRDGPAGSCEDFWALNDISFDIHHGEVLGIIGRNGAGKSTLLKIVSQITKPTAGCVRLYGRVASLLEVGTGFHPELTGRENIYLNGSILGMSHLEIRRRFDEIVDFSGVQKFLDTPIKRYSSGMKVRLAFSVAAHLEPEILIIDEVLAVGDAEFQKKCLGKMGEVASSGRTILFVSHNMGAIESLCSKCALLCDGHITFLGDTETAIERYRSSFAAIDSISVEQRSDRRGTGTVRLSAISLLDSNNKPTDCLPMGTPLHINLEYSALAPVSFLNVSVAVTSDTGQRLFRLNTVDMSYRVPGFVHSQSLTCTTEPLCLLPGRYYLSVGIADEHTLLDEVQNARDVTIIESNAMGNGCVPRGPGAVMFMRSSWQVSKSI